tara:strand:+ start:1305 stop:1565 length:261 start_codon:yes stop_codon:yes gene_type:complete
MTLQMDVAKFLAEQTITGRSLNALARSLGRLGLRRTAQIVPPVGVATELLFVVAKAGKKGGTVTGLRGSPEIDVYDASALGTSRII